MYELLARSFLLVDNTDCYDDSTSNNIHLFNMWTMYCGIARDKSNHEVPTVIDIFPFQEAQDYKMCNYIKHYPCHCTEIFISLTYSSFYIRLLSWNFFYQNWWSENGKGCTYVTAVLVIMESTPPVSLGY